MASMTSERVGRSARHRVKFTTEEKKGVKQGMWNYKQPDFALRLLHELQKQQQCSLHCDILLQTEGVSIPAHSCVLSALSPVFYRAFANVPSFPVGQSRLVKLEAVGVRALMKLVGFMYSGEMVGESLDDQQEVIDIAYRLGFSNFMEGKQKQVNEHQNKNSAANWWEIGLQTEEPRGRKKDASVQILSEKVRFSHSGTQTDSAEAPIADTHVASEPELSIDKPDELTEVPSEYNHISPDVGLAWIDKIVTHSPSNSTEALVRVHTKHQKPQMEKKRAKISKKQGDTHISLKIKLKRQRSGELWKIVSVKEESTVVGSKTRGSSDDLPVMHTLAETYNSSVEVHLSPSPSLICQNLETVTLTPPSELTTPLPATPTKPLLEHFCLHSPDLTPLSSHLQIAPQSPCLSQPEESEEHIAKLLETITVDLNILPLVTVEGNSSMYAHLDQKVEKCTTLDNSPASYCSLLGNNLGTMGPGTTSGISEQREEGSGALSSCRTWDLKNVTSVASYPILFSYTSPCITQKKNIESSFTSPCFIKDVPSKLTFDAYAQSEKQTESDASVSEGFETRATTDTSNTAQDDPTPVGKQFPEQLHATDQELVWHSSDVDQAPNFDNWADFSEMRLPQCLSPLTSEAGKITGFSTQDLLRPLKFSSCLSRVNVQPTLRYTSSPSKPQALSGKSNQANPSFIPLRVNELHCSVVGKRSCLLRSNREQNGEASECKLEEIKIKNTDYEDDLLKGMEDNILDRQMNESAVRGLSTARHSVEALNEPCRKKAKMAGYLNGGHTQTMTVVNPCSVKIKNVRHIDNIQCTNIPVTSETPDCLKAAKTRKTMSVDLKSQNWPLKQRSHAFKSAGQESWQKDAWDIKQASSLVVNPGFGRSLKKRTCSEALMEDLSKISKLHSLSAAIPSSSLSHHTLKGDQMSKECIPKDGSGRSHKVHHHPLRLTQTITEVKDLSSEHEKNNAPEPEINPFVEPKTVIQDLNLNSEENKQPERYSSLNTKANFCNEIFHQTAFNVGTSVTQHFLPINHQLRSILQTTDRKIRTSLPPSLICNRDGEHPINIKTMMDNNEQEKKDTPEDGATERVFPGTDKPDSILDKSKDKKMDSKNKVGSEQESSTTNVNECLLSGIFEISAQTGFTSIHDVSVELNLSKVAPTRDFNNNVGMENNSQYESTTAILDAFRLENVMEKPKPDERISESLCTVPVSNKPKEVKLIKTKVLQLVGTGSTQMVRLEREEVSNKEKENENAGIQESLNANEAGISDSEVDVMDEGALLATGQQYGVVATGETTGDIDVVENQMSDEMGNDGEALVHDELNGQQVLRTDVEVMPPDEARVEMTSEIINIEASPIRHGEVPDISSFSVEFRGTSVVMNTVSAEDGSSTDEELIVDDSSDSPIHLGAVVDAQCSTVLEEENKVENGEVIRRREEEEDVDVTGEESN